MLRRNRLDSEWSKALINELDRHREYEDANHKAWIAVPRKYHEIHLSDAL